MFGGKKVVYPIKRRPWFYCIIMWWWSNPRNVFFRYIRAEWTSRVNLAQSCRLSGFLCPQGLTRFSVLLDGHPDPFLPSQPLRLCPPSSKNNNYRRKYHLSPDCDLHNFTCVSRQTSEAAEAEHRIYGDVRGRFLETCSWDKLSNK